jgi:adenylosuccinate lyase
MIPNVLAERYASPAMAAIWSPAGKILLERELWIAVMKAQQGLGLSIPAEAITAYEATKHDIRLDRIMERERVTRHDVKARIDEFCELAGHEHLHKGMTSRDLTENVEQLQVFRALRIVMEKAVAVLAAMAQQAETHRAVILTARTHNVAAQTTTLGKRIAMFAEELHGSMGALQSHLQSYAVRGLKGATGTQLDQLNLFAGDVAKVTALETALRDHLGLPAAHIAVGQVYPRSQDFRTEFCENTAPHGGARSRQRGLCARPNGIERHASQDEQPIVRTDQRLSHHPQRLSHDGRRPRGRPME